MRYETVVYKTVGDLEIHADIYRPDDDATRPVIVYIHGGALMMGWRGWIDPIHLEAYRADGFAVVSIDYRLAPESLLPAIASDLDDAFAWVAGEGARRFGFDPGRIAVVGHSAGGYLTLLAGHRIRPRPRALVSFYGYGDIVGSWYSRPDPFYNLRPPISEGVAWAGVGDRPVAAIEAVKDRGRSDFYLYCRQQGLWPLRVTGFDPDREPDAFRPYCPVQNVTPEYPPTLLLHGDHDTDVPYEQSVLMAAALQNAGVAHELITIPGGPHSFERDHDDSVVASAFEKVRAFLATARAG